MGPLQGTILGPYALGALMAPLQAPILGPYALRGPNGPLQGSILGPYAPRGPNELPCRALSQGPTPLGALLGPWQSPILRPTPQGVSKIAHNTD